MNWEAIGAIGEVIGAIAVVGSIFYLAVQIRTNTKAITASASFDGTHSWAEFNENLLSLPDEHLELVIKTYDSTTTVKDVSAVEYMRMGMFHRAILQKLEGQYYLFKYGFLEPGVWIKRRNVAVGLLNIPFYKVWWAEELRASTYSDEFVSALEEGDSVDTANINTKPSQ